LLDACITSVLSSLHDAVPEFGEHVAIDGSDQGRVTPASGHFDDIAKRWAELGDGDSRPNQNSSRRRAAMPDTAIRHVLGISGGKDSAALAIYMRDKEPEMEYFFCALTPLIFTRATQFRDRCVGPV
jgi:hypothetical protein